MEYSITDFDELIALNKTLSEIVIRYLVSYFIKLLSDLYSVEVEYTAQKTTYPCDRNNGDVWS